MARRNHTPPALDGSLLFQDRLCNHSAPLTPVGAALPPPRSSRRSWPSPSEERLGSHIIAISRLQSSLSYGLAARSPPRRLCHDASTVGSLLPPATSYWAAWPLPGPDSHRQAHPSLQDTLLASAYTQGLCRTSAGQTGLSCSTPDHDQVPIPVPRGDPPRPPELGAAGMAFTVTSAARLLHCDCADAAGFARG